MEEKKEEKAIKEPIEEIEETNLHMQRDLLDRSHLTSDLPQPVPAAVGRAPGI